MEIVGVLLAVIGFGAVLKWLFGSGESNSDRTIAPPAASQTAVHGLKKQIDALDGRLRMVEKRFDDFTPVECSACHHKNDPDAEYCAQCGEKLYEDDEPDGQCSARAVSS